MALTSRWLASHGASSAVKPVSTFATPPGRSDVASTSASEIAGSGRRSEATITACCRCTAPARATLTKPSRLDSCGARIATTPVGSGSEKLKYGPATGFAEPATCANLSAQPAYQTMRSIASSDARERASAASGPRPRRSRRRTARGGRRASRRAVDHLAAVVRASLPTSRGRPCARRRRRRARPCARPAPRSREQRRPTRPRPGTTRPDSERGKAPPIASL